MKKATLALFSVAAAVSMAGMANAVPFGPNNLPAGLVNQGGSPPGLANQGGSNTGFGVVGGLPTGVNNPLIVSQATPVSSVPEGGSSGVILLGAGLFGLALLGRRLQRSY